MTLLAVVIGACTQQGGGTTSGNATDQADPNGELVTNMGSEPDNIDPQQSQFVQEIGVNMKVIRASKTFMFTPISWTNCDCCGSMLSGSLPMFVTSSALGSA